MGKNDTHTWEDKPSPREIYGEPEPSGKVVVITDRDRALADMLLENAKDMIVQFVRRAPNRYFTFEENNNNVSYDYGITGSGPPVGCVLAFMHENNVYIGWSRYNTGSYLDKDGFKAKWEKFLDAHGYAPVAQISVLLNEMAKTMAPTVPVEPLPFSKEDARRVAVLRGLCDDIIMTDIGTFITGDGDEIPVDVQRVIRRVLSRAKAYFKGVAIKNFSSATKDVAGAKVLYAAS